MLALPIQGFAAASMLYCGMRSDQQGAESATSRQSHHHMASADNGSDQAMKTMASVHDHSDFGAMAAEPDQVISTASQMPHMPGKMPDGAHKCGVCASCCSLMGIADVPTILVAHSAPEAQYLDPLVLAYAVSLWVPEKPPRA